MSEKHATSTRNGRSNGSPTSQHDNTDDDSSLSCSDEDMNDNDKNNTVSSNGDRHKHPAPTAATTSLLNVAEPCHMALIVMAKGSESVDILSCSNILQKFGIKVVLAAAASSGLSSAHMSEEEQENEEIKKHDEMPPSLIQSWSMSPFHDNNHNDTVLQLEAECTFQQALENTWSILILPGGIDGVTQLVQDTNFRTLLSQHIEQHQNLVGALGASATELLEQCGYSTLVFRKEHDGDDYYQYQHRLLLLQRDLVDENGRQITPIVRQDQYYRRRDYTTTTRTNDSDQQYDQGQEEIAKVIWTTPGLGTSPYLALALGEQLYGYEKAQQVANLTPLPPLSFSVLCHHDNNNNKNNSGNSTTENDDDHDDSDTSDAVDESSSFRQQDWYIQQLQKQEKQQHRRRETKSYNKATLPAVATTSSPPSKDTTSFDDRLFEHIAWRRLRKMGWTRKCRNLSKTRNAHLRHPFSYEPPSPMDTMMNSPTKRTSTGSTTPTPTTPIKKNKKRKASVAAAAAVSSCQQQQVASPSLSRLPSSSTTTLVHPQEVLNFLIHDSVWSRKKASFRIVDLYLSCQRIRQMYLMDIPSCCNSPEAVEQETKRRMTALSNY